MGRIMCNMFICDVGSKFIDVLIYACGVGSKVIDDISSIVVMLIVAMVATCLVAFICVGISMFISMFIPPGPIERERKRIVRCNKQLKRMDDARMNQEVQSELAKKKDHVSQAVKEEQVMHIELKESKCPKECMACTMESPQPVKRSAAVIIKRIMVIIAITVCFNSACSPTTRKAFRRMYHTTPTYFDRTYDPIGMLWVISNAVVTGSVRAVVVVGILTGGILGYMYLGNVMEFVATSNDGKKDTMCDTSENEDITEQGV